MRDLGQVLEQEGCSRPRTGRNRRPVAVRARQPSSASRPCTCRPMDSFQAAAGLQRVARGTRLKSEPTDNQNVEDGQASLARLSPALLPLSNHFHQLLARLLELPGVSRRAREGVGEAI